MFTHLDDKLAGGVQYIFFVFVLVVLKPLFRVVVFDPAEQVERLFGKALKNLSSL